jgi:RimJ/RimL family protein N-acetyltransferase
MKDLAITTERLLLRPVCTGDLDVAAALGADPRVMAWFGGTLTAERSEQWLRRQIEHWRAHGFGRFAATFGGVVVGFVGLTRTEYDAGFIPGIEIAWRLAFDHWGKGYATEAARAVAREGFERLGLEQIVGVTTPGNTRSRRVMERLGMVHARRRLRASARARGGSAAASRRVPAPQRAIEVSVSSSNQGPPLPT